MGGLGRVAPHSAKGAIEALLLVSGDAVPATELARTLGIAPGEAAEACADLAAEYADAGRGFQLREVAGGWRLFTHPAYHDQVESYVRSWDTRRLSQAALETLAVIAYHQPVTREGVKAVRGVNSEGVIASLKEKGLVREIGHGRSRGGATRFGTTRAFLEKFGLRSLADLPPLEDFAPDEQARRFIRERLSGHALSSALEDVADDLDESRAEADAGAAGPDRGREDGSEGRGAWGHEPQEGSEADADPWEAGREVDYDADVFGGGTLDG